MATFVDTNVLLYAISSAEQEAEKRAIARRVARSLGCSEVLTEDLQDEQDFGGINAVNPFRNGGR